MERRLGHRHRLTSNMTFERILKLTYFIIHVIQFMLGWTKTLIYIIKFYCISIQIFFEKSDQQFFGKTFNTTYVDSPSSRPIY